MAKAFIFLWFWWTSAESSYTAWRCMTRHCMPKRKKYPKSVEALMITMKGSFPFGTFWISSWFPSFHISILRIPVISDSRFTILWPVANWLRIHTRLLTIVAITMHLGPEPINGTKKGHIWQAFQREWERVVPRFFEGEVFASFIFFYDPLKQFKAKLLGQGWDAMEEDSCTPIKLFLLIPYTCCWSV